MTTSTIISVPNDERLHRILAEAVVEVSHPGYQRKGWYVNIETWDVFSPVNDTEVTDECIDIANFFDSDNSYDPSVNWDLQWGEKDFLNKMLIEWAKQESDDSDIFEDDGSLADWVSSKDSKKSAIVWGWAQPRWKDQLKQIEQANYENAISFAEQNILSEVEIG